MQLALASEEQEPKHLDSPVYLCAWMLYLPNLGAASGGASGAAADVEGEPDPAGYPAIEKWVWGVWLC